MEYPADNRHTTDRAISTLSPAITEEPTTAIAERSHRLINDDDFLRLPCHLDHSIVRSILMVTLINRNLQTDCYRNESSTEKNGLLVEAEDATQRKTSKAQS